MPRDLGRVADQADEHGAGKDRVDTLCMDRLGLMRNGQRRRHPAAVLALAGDERAVAPELAAWRGELLVEAATEIRQIFVTDVAIGDRIGALGEALAEPRALFWRIERFGGQFVLPEPIAQGFGFVVQRLEISSTRPRDEICV